MNALRWKQFSTDPAVWWVGSANAMRLGAGILLLPLMVTFLSKPELGMHYLFVHLLSLVPIIDFGFSITVSRSVSYAAAGARDLDPHGFQKHEPGIQPNRVLLWQLVEEIRRFYRWVSVITLLLLGVGGTLLVWKSSASLDQDWGVKIAWAIALAAAAWEIYSSWWNVYLTGLNEVVWAARFTLAFYGVRFALAAILLISGLGLLSLPIAGLVAGVLQRTLSRRKVLQILGQRPEGLTRTRWFSVLWPNTWRTGLQYLSNYLLGSANAIFCSQVYGLEANSAYGLSLQLMGFMQGISSVWTSTQWPKVNQERLQHNSAAIHSRLRVRYGLQHATFLVLAVIIVTVVPVVLGWIAPDKNLLPRFWLALLALNAFLEMHFSFWTTLLSTENRIPYLWPTVLTNVLSFILVVVLVFASQLQLGAFVIGPLVAGILFNYWFWVKVGARSLNLTWRQFLWAR